MASGADADADANAESFATRSLTWFKVDSPVMSITVSRVWLVVGSVVNRIRTCRTLSLSPGFSKRYIRHS
jgi:hypothetical protein